MFHRALPLVGLTLAACAYDWSPRSARPADSGAHPAGDGGSIDGGATTGFDASRAMSDDAASGGDGATGGCGADRERDGGACVPLDDCAGDPCGAHAAACHDDVASFRCECRDLWTGTLCDTEQPLMLDPISVAVDGKGEHAFAASAGDDYFAPVLVRIDLASGERSVVSGFDPRTGAPRGSGPTLEHVQAVELDEGAGRALVLDRDRLAILSVDLDTGTRQVLSDDDHGGMAVGAGPALSNPSDLALDLPHGRVLVTDIGYKAVVAVSLATGNRSIFSTDFFQGAAIGSGPALEVPTGIAIDAARDRAVISELSSGSVIAIDLATANRSMLSDGAQSSAPTPPDKPAVVGAGPLVIDAASDRALVLDRSQKTVFSVQLVTGDRSLLSRGDPDAPRVGKGHPWKSPTDLALDPARRRVLVSDEDSDTLLSMSLDTGDRELFGRYAVGTGPTFSYPLAVVEDVARERLIVAASDTTGLLAVDPDSGARQVFSGVGADGILVGQGPTFRRASGIAIDRDGNRLFVTDTDMSGTEEGVVFAVDLTTGDRTIFSAQKYAGISLGTGPAWYTRSGIAGIVLDRERERLLVATQEDIVAIALATGNRSQFADIELNPLRLALSPDEKQLYVAVADFFGDKWQLLALDLDTAEQRVVSGIRSDGATQGLGPAFRYCEGVALSSDGSLAYIADMKVLEVDVLSGHRRVVSGLLPNREAIGAGALGMLSELSFDARGRLLATDTALRALVTVDLATGKRTILSRGEP